MEKIYFLVRYLPNYIGNGQKFEFESQLAHVNIFPRGNIHSGPFLLNWYEIIYFHIYLAFSFLMNLYHPIDMENLISFFLTLAWLTKICPYAFTKQNCLLSGVPLLHPKLEVSYISCPYFRFQLNILFLFSKMKPLVFDKQL